MNVVVSVFSVAAIIYQLQEIFSSFQEPWLHSSVHLTVSLVLIWLVILQKKTRWWPAIIMVIAASIFVETYMYVVYPELQARAGLPPTPADTVVGIITIGLVLETTRRVVGWSLTIVALLFIGYALAGHYLGGPFKTLEHSPFDVVAWLTTNTRGIYGILLETSAYFIFPFMVMGGLLGVTAALGFFNAVGTQVGRAVAGGPAMTAVVSSCLLGTILGSGVANVAISGSFTIPAMKRAGFSPHEAGAIEAAASTGGQIMPPVMGIAAFIMATFTGIPYATIAIAAALPAIVYFGSVAVYVMLTGLKRNVRFVEGGELPSMRELLISAPSFFTPVAVIVVLLAMHFSLPYVGVWAVISVIAVGFFRPGKPASLGAWNAALCKGAMMGAYIAVACATIGIIVQVMIITGLVVKLPMIIQQYAGGSLIIALPAIGALTIILGMGVPTSVAYIVAALVTAPILTRLGLPLLTAHLFVFYFAVMALVSPPIAEAAIVGSRIAGSSYLRTAVEATKVAAAGWLVPFVFVVCPALLMRPEGSVLWIATSMIALVTAIVSMQAGFVGFLFSTVGRFGRGLFLLYTLVLLFYIVVLHSYAIFIGGMILVSLSAIMNKKRQKTAVIVLDHPETIQS